MEKQAVNYLGDIVKLKLEPGDRLILKCAVLLNAQQKNRLYENFIAAFPDMPPGTLVIMDQGLDIEVIAKAD